MMIMTMMMVIMTMMFIDIFIKIVITIYLYSTVSQLALFARKMFWPFIGLLTHSSNEL